MSLRGGSRAVLLDRDGTLIREDGYLRRVEDLELLPGVADALRLLASAGLKLVVVTNQSAVARGLLTEAQLRAIHDELERRLARERAFLDAIYYCPHHPTEGREPYRIACGCRKPATGLAERAAAEFDLDLARCFVVGDQATDMEFATRIGARGFLVRPPDGGAAGSSGDHDVVKDLAEAARKIANDCAR
jgi:D-glycero-D-manno-heptose 1,7-bisphosphate phosphatase